tara:strand:+ start:136 stop:873 length:738 start_codon:yes stop_codon:yes gene_type:complete
MGYKTKSMINQASEKPKAGSTYSRGNQPLDFNKMYDNTYVETKSSLNKDMDLGGMIAMGLSNIPKKSMSGFDKKIKESKGAGKLKKAARLEKKQAGFQRRQERGSARYAERKGTEPIYSTDKEELLPNREDTFLGIRKNRVSNEDRKEQIARRVKENRERRQEGSEETVGDILLNETNPVTQSLTPVSLDNINKALNINSDSKIEEEINAIKKMSQNPFPGVFDGVTMMSDGFNKGMLRKNKYKK